MASEGFRASAERLKRRTDRRRTVVCAGNHCGAKSDSFPSTESHSRIELGLDRTRCVRHEGRERLGP